MLAFCVPKWFEFAGGGQPLREGGVENTCVFPLFYTLRFPLPFSGGFYPDWQRVYSVAGLAQGLAQAINVLRFV